VSGALTALGDLASQPDNLDLLDGIPGSGHEWRLIDDQPWRRAYVVKKPGARDAFVAKAP